MPTSIRMFLGPTAGGLFQGNFGTYQAAADGTVTVDSRDAPTILQQGGSYIQLKTASYNAPIAPAAANAVRYVASGALSNGALVVANQPDVMRQATIVVGAGTAAISAGTVSVPYIANDGTTQTDNLSLVTPASGTSTLFLSKGLVHLNTPTVSGLVGGALPFIQMGSTAALSVPLDPNSKDIAFLKETIDTGDEAVGTVSTVTIGTITPTTAPNATHTYSFVYSTVIPEQ